MSNSKKDHHFENISEEKCKAFLRFKSNRNIIIQKPDKGKTAVALDWPFFLSKIEENAFWYQQIFKDKAQSNT